MECNMLITGPTLLTCCPKVLNEENIEKQSETHEGRISFKKKLKTKT